jgi:cell division protein FtsQ
VATVGVLMQVMGHGLQVTGNTVFPTHNYCLFFPITHHLFSGGSLMRRFFLLSLLLLLLGLVYASRYYPTVQYIQVSGNVRFTANEVAALAGVSVSDPMLWMTEGQINALASNPWIQNAQFIRAFPTAVHIQITERVPVLTDTVQSYALDGTVLPDVNAAARQSLIQLRGWGENRIVEALELVALVNADTRHTNKLKMISYSSAGFTLQFETNTELTREIFTPSVEALKTQWASVMTLSETSQTIALYPWGVTAHE